MALVIGELSATLGVDDQKFTSGLKAAEGQFSGFGQRIGQAAKAVGVAAGAVAGVALVAGLVSNLNVETAQAKLAAQMGGVGPVSERLGGVAGKLYADAYGESIGDVSQAVRLVAQNIKGMSTASAGDVQKVTGRVISLAQAFDQDVGGATRAVDQLMRTGLASSAQNALDIMTAGFQAGNDEAGDLLDTINEYSTQFRKVGLDGATAMGLISQGLNAGARDADVVADAIKEFSIRAVDGSKLTKQGFEAVGLSAGDMATAIGKGGPTAAAALDLTLQKLSGIKDPAQRAQAAVALFGTQAEDLGAALFALDPSTATSAMGDVGGAAQQMDQTLNDTAQVRLEAVKRKVEQWAGSLTGLPGPLGTAGAGVVAFGGTFLSTVAPIGMMITAQRAASAAAVASGAAQSRGAMMTGVAWIGAAAKAVGSGVVMAASFVATAAVAIASTLASVAVVVAGWTMMGLRALASAAQMALAWLIALGPIGLVIALVAAVVAGIIMNWDTVKAWTLAAWNAIKTAIMAAWAFIVTVVTTYINIVKTVISTVFNFIVSIITAYLNAARAVVSAGWSAIAAVVRTYVNAVKAVISWFGGLPGMFRGWFNAAKDAATSALSSLVSFVRGIPGKITSALGNLGRLLYGAGKDVIQGLINGIKAAAGKVAAAARAIIDKIPAPIRKAMGISSPSKVMRTIGHQIGDGLVLGLGDRESRVAGSAKKLIAAAQKAGYVQAEDGSWVPRSFYAGRSGGSTFEGTLVLDSGEFLGKVRGEVGKSQKRLARDLSVGRA